MIVLASCEGAFPYEKGLVLGRLLLLVSGRAVAGLLVFVSTGVLRGYRPATTEARQLVPSLPPDREMTIPVKVGVASLMLATHAALSIAMVAGVGMAWGEIAAFNVALALIHSLVIRHNLRSR